MTILRAHIQGLWVAVATFAGDQLVKWLVSGPLALRALHEGRVINGQWDAATPDIPLLPIFGLSWAENYGVSLGLFTANSDAQRWALVAMTGLIAAGVLIWMLRETRRADTLPLGLILGGALGNILDRVALGHVVDYADLHFGAWRPFLIFNLADVAITFGVLIILARSFLSREKQAGDTSEPAYPAPES
ncbi:signal peptidase II [Novosphingobium sp. FSY-8]|uniref:Lipoprotein signal peptidase n=1 Tax=Novosphingobium ovatum TaxID=1908523 RepID=A0ABW9XEG3_9SPHN|nr:signal peptidase II [Novosphingobium ovatum]NBC36929.1 signal peptidase II [Novosphingobium ovatum]